MIISGLVFLWASSKTIHTRSPRFLNRRPPWSVVQYQSASRTLSWWFWPVHHHRYAQICRMVLQWQCMHQAWPHRFLRKLSFAFFSCKFPWCCRTQWNLCYWHRVHFYHWMKTKKPSQNISLCIFKKQVRDLTRGSHIHNMNSSFLELGLD